LLKAPGAALSRNKGTEKVARILCLWEPAQGQGLDEKPGRGFAGQILFFEHGQSSPSPVKGIVKVHEYDNYDPDRMDQIPVHTFTFDSGAWNAHMAEGTLGHSYNVFIPYVMKHNNQAHCALQVEFIPENGRPVLSPFTKISLQGRSGSRSSYETAIQRDVVSRSVERTADAADADRRPRSLESVTIELPRSARRGPRR
jgi:hypothetical protein